MTNALAIQVGAKPRKPPPSTRYRVAVGCGESGLTGEHHHGALHLVNGPTFADELNFGCKWRVFWRDTRANDKAYVTGNLDIHGPAKRQRTLRTRAPSAFQDQIRQTHSRRVETSRSRVPRSAEQRLAAEFPTYLQPATVGETGLWPGGPILRK
jgi:hypothetical protein